jgi:CDP-diacylglycerol--glycerol-3-phosphate 3-phosphatidyltransferase
MNLPNILTLSRIGFAGIIVYLLLLNSLVSHYWAALVFILASITDYYDGSLAKRYGMITDFGKIMDPIADKVLMLSIFFTLAFLGVLAWWMVMIIALREIVVTIDRLWRMRQGQVLPAEKAGKIKTVLQIVAVAFILIYLILDQAEFAYSWFHQFQNIYLAGINGVMTIVVGVTVYSGLSYWKQRTQKDAL